MRFLLAFLIAATAAASTPDDAVPDDPDTEANESSAFLVAALGRAAIFESPLLYLSQKGRSITRLDVEADKALLLLRAKAFRATQRDREAGIDADDERLKQEQLDDAVHRANAAFRSRSRSRVDW